MTIKVGEMAEKESVYKSRQQRNKCAHGNFGSRREEVVNDRVDAQTRSCYVCCGTVCRCNFRFSN